MSIALLLLNVLGVVVYLIAASHSWTLPQEQGINSTAGEPFVWALYVIPIWVVFSFVDLIWGTVIIKRRQWLAGRMLPASALVWMAAVVVDFVHH